MHVEKLVHNFNFCFSGSLTYASRILRRARTALRRTSEGDRRRYSERRTRTRHLTEPTSRTTDSDSDSEEKFNFDLSVAAQHSYLGLQGEVNNRKVFYPDNSVITIPMLESSRGINNMPIDIILPGQDIPINAVTEEMRFLLENVLKSENKLMGYSIRVSNLKDQLPPLERNESNDEIEIGCTLRVRHSATNQSPNIISGTSNIRYIIYRSFVQCNL